MAKYSIEAFRLIYTSSGTCLDHAELLRALGACIHRFCENPRAHTRKILGKHSLCLGSAILSEGLVTLAYESVEK